ncbi:MAG: site-specific tyrosine recombinase/integron integrase [Cyclobacteriaceae bacterium]
MVTIVIKNDVFMGLPVIRLDFPYDFALKELVKSYPECQWSMKHKVWWVPYRDTQLDEMIRFFRGRAWLDYSQLKKIDIAKEFPNTIKLDGKTEKEMQSFIEWMRNKRYAESTIKTYKGALILFFRFLDNKELSEIGNEDLEYYNTHYIIQRGFSASYQSQFINAVKLYFSIRQKQKLNPEIIDRPKKPKLLPNVLAKEEIKRILNAHKNLKHRTMLSLIYACGLRRSELLNLKIIDVDSNRGLLIVRQSKGKKDRVVPLSVKTVDLLREYYKFEKPNNYLFEGEKLNSRYSEGSLQKVLKSAVEKSGIKKSVTLHWLRHSYATHLLENGTDLRYIQEILGHSSSRTTEIYTHVTDNSIRRIKSPFDDL